MREIYGNYEISESGEIFCIGYNTIRNTTLKNGVKCEQSIHVKRRKLKPYINNVGYLVHNICGSVKYVHHMVYEAYIGKRTKGMTLNHIDGNKLNNHISNLEEVSYAENNAHAKRMGLNKLVLSDYTKRIKVLAYKNGVFVRCFNSAADAEKELNAHHVGCICAGKRKSSNGYTFKYA